MTWLRSTASAPERAPKAKQPRVPWNPGLLAADLRKDQTAASAGTFAPASSAASSAAGAAATAPRFR